MKPLRQFDLNLLIIFDALLSECHVSRAAEKVFLSQSAMSHALNRLREQLDDPILIRTDKGLQPTPRALAMLPEVRQALQLIEHSLSRPAAFDPTRSERTFRLACTDYVETVIFPDWFSQLRTQAPGIKVEIDLIADDTSRQRLEQRQVDLVLGMDASQQLPRHLQSESWLQERYCCLVADEHPLQIDQLSLSDYLAQEHILFFDLEGETSSNIDRWLHEQGLQRQFSARTTNYMAAARLTARSQALMTLPYHMGKLFCEMLPLRLLEPPQGIPAIAMTLVQHPLYADDPAIVWLKQSLHTYAQQLAGK